MLHQHHQAYAVAGRIKGKENPEKDDHERAGHDRRCAAKDEPGMAEKTGLIGEHPLRKVPAPFGAEQVDAACQKMLLKDVEPSIHDVHEGARL